MKEIINRLQLILNTLPELFMPSTRENVFKMAGIYQALEDVKNELLDYEKANGSDLGEVKSHVT